MDLRGFFAAHPRAALAFSGGADSSYLLYEGLRYAEELGVYYVKSAFQPEFERRDALRMAEALSARMRVLEADVLACPAVAANPPDRCYHCKKVIMSTIKAAAAADGFELVLDGTNASDDIADRPGFKALGEEGVLSPLRLCGLTKAEIRARSREAGLFTWDKPAYACLATRVKTGQPIDADTLRAVEAGEEALFALGFTDFRVRTAGGRARLEFTAEQLGRAREKMPEIRARLAPYFTAVDEEATERERSI
ncbi:MAG: ATP-dependent sacrificial sulfur transferase LarE [Oscillospiraceae bacterium]|nr:ATP-dependent sacrificial sulfur transferase LarE [Oscillospiraceae bacterium]